MVNPRIAIIEINEKNNDNYKISITMTNSQMFNNITISIKDYIRLIDTHNPQIIDLSIFAMKDFLIEKLCQ